METPSWRSSEEPQDGGRKRVKAYSSLSQRLCSLCWAFNHAHRRFSYHVGLSTSKTHGESMFSCKWLACEQKSLCHALWKTLKFKLLYFQNRARYRAENMQADTFLKWLLRNEDKSAKVCLLLNFSSFWRHVEAPCRSCEMWDYKERKWRHFPHE